MNIKSMFLIDDFFKSFQEDEELINRLNARISMESNEDKRHNFKSELQLIKESKDNYRKVLDNLYCQAITTAKLFKDINGRSL